MIRVALFSLVAVSLAAQSASDEKLARIRNLMADNLRRLPNYTCLMTINRSVQPPARGRSSRTAGYEDMVRVEVAEVGSTELFGWPGSKLEGKIGEMVGGGLTATGDFAALANIVFRSTDPTFQELGEKKLNNKQAVEYAYNVSREASMYQLQTGRNTAVVGFRGNFWADTQTSELLRLELFIEQIPSQIDMTHVRTTIDYQKSRIGGGDFLLPSRVDRFVEARDGTVQRNTSVFSNCRQYGAESSIRFDATDEKGEDAVATAKPRAPIRLPVGVRLPMKLESGLDLRNAAIGDPLVARLTSEVKAGTLSIAAGSEVHGRIRALVHYTKDGNYRLEMEFTEIRARDASYILSAFLEDVQHRKDVVRGNVFGVPGFLEAEGRRPDLSGLEMVYRTIATTP